MMGYKKVGANIEAGYKSMELMKEYVKGIMRPEVLGGLGGLSGAFSVPVFRGMEEPTLLSGTDGMGIKLKLVFLMNKHDTVEIDCVVMYVSDVACTGGESLLFLDYTACGKNASEEVATTIRDVAGGCRQFGSALIGGETAEIPGFYPGDEYDLAGFLAGIAGKEDLITSGDLCVGDVLIGVAPSDVHSNGFSLMRKVFEREPTKEGLNTYYDELGTTPGEALIAPTRVYVKALRNIRGADVTIEACSHITGDSFYENIPYVLRDGVKAVIRRDSYPVPPVFKLLTEKGRIGEQTMYNTYNMGLGVIVAVDPADVEKTMKAMEAASEAPCIVGSIEKGGKGASLC